MWPPQRATEQWSCGTRRAYVVARQWIAFRGSRLSVSPRCCPRAAAPRSPPPPARCRRREGEEDPSRRAHPRALDARASSAATGSSTGDWFGRFIFELGARQLAVGHSHAAAAVDRELHRVGDGRSGGRLRAGGRSGGRLRGGGRHGRARRREEGAAAATAGGA
jgi:hypothetical protein